jgi:imidazoleglycerol-phosphate dehydratase
VLGRTPSHESLAKQLHISARASSQPRAQGESHGLRQKQRASKHVQHGERALGQTNRLRIPLAPGAQAEGDLHIDDHHTVEDVGIALGQALTQAMGDKRGIVRYGACLLPMDDTLVRAALDLSARPYLVWKVDFTAPAIKGFDTELVREFFQAFATHGGITLHVEKLDGINSHHIAEAAFKAVARALRDALETDPRKGDAIPSTKGML